MEEFKEHRKKFEKCLDDIKTLTFNSSLVPLRRRDRWFIIEHYFEIRNKLVFVLVEEFKNGFRVKKEKS